MGHCIVTSMHPAGSPPAGKNDCPCYMCDIRLQNGSLVRIHPFGTEIIGILKAPGSTAWTFDFKYNSSAWTLKRCMFFRFSWKHLNLHASKCAFRKRFASESKRFASESKRFAGYCCAMPCSSCQVAIRPLVCCVFPVVVILWCPPVPFTCLDTPGPISFWGRDL